MPFLGIEWTTNGGQMEANSFCQSSQSRLESGFAPVTMFAMMSSGTGLFAWTFARALSFYIVATNSDADTGQRKARRWRSTRRWAVAAARGRGSAACSGRQSEPVRRLALGCTGPGAGDAEPQRNLASRVGKDQLSQGHLTTRQAAQAVSLARVGPAPLSSARAHWRCGNSVLIPTTCCRASVCRYILALGPAVS